MFINDRCPKASSGKHLQTEADWQVIPTCGQGRQLYWQWCRNTLVVTIGKDALVGGGAGVTHDVQDYSIVVGAPARVTKHVNERM